MLFLYIGALALGGALIAFSILLGGGEHGGDNDHDHDHDHDHDPEVELDHDHDHDHELGGGADQDVEVASGGGGGGSSVGGGGEGLWLPFLSMRFWTFGLASFGLAGSLLSLLQVNAVIAAVASIFLGLLMGWVVAWLFRLLKKSAVTAEVSTQTLQGSEANVLLSVGSQKMGKIRLLMGDRHVDLMAHTRDEGLIERGQRVLIVQVTDGVAEVTRYTAGDPVRGRVSRHQTQEH